VLGVAVQILRETLMLDVRAASGHRRFGRVATAFAALVDIVAFCSLLAAGASLRSSHIAAFAVGIALSWLLQYRALGAAAALTRGRSYLRIVTVALMALFLRGGVLALLTQRFAMPPQFAIVFAVAAGLGVTMPGFSYGLSGGQGRSRSQAFAFGIIAYAAVLRLVYAGSVEMMPEETYYWNYSRHLAIGYLDHPPMVAWLIRLGTALFGHSEFGVRAGALCCGAITSVFVYRLARNLFDATTALAALLLAQALPFFFLSGMLMTPDAPLTAAWAASLYFLERALIAQQAQAWWRCGIALGMGMISKYSIGLLVPVTLAFMIWDPPSRRWWRRPEPYMAAVLALAIFSPVIIWNAQHDWASFAFQTSRRWAEAPRFSLHRLVLAVIVLITPTGVIALVAALATGNRGVGDDPQQARRRRLMTLAILVPLSVFVLFSLRHEVKLDWTGAMWTAALPALACTMIGGTAMIGGLRAWLRTAWAPTVAAMLLIYGAGLHYLVLGLPGAGYARQIELLPVGWRDLSAHIIKTAAAFREQSGDDVLIVGMDRYVIASELAFYGAGILQADIETMNSHLFGGMSLMYGQWTPPAAQHGRNLLLVAFDPAELAGPSVESHLDRLGPIEDDVLMRDGAVIRHYYHRLGYGYRSVAAD
jgi:dolichol-phosphate mannosyltransferase